MRFETGVSCNRRLRGFVERTELAKGFDYNGRSGATLFAVVDLERQAQSARIFNARQHADRIDAFRADFRDEFSARRAH